MDVNFKEALAVLYRALPMVLFRAGIFVAGGFTITIIFGMLLFVFRITGGASQAVIVAVIATVVLGLWISCLVGQRFFLYRYRAAMLLLFSGWKPPFPGLAAVSDEAGRFFPDYSGWARVNHGLRRVLSAFYRGGKEFPILPASGRFSRIFDLLAIGSLSQAILVLAFSCGGTDFGRVVRENLALYFQHGYESRRLARQWLIFSAVGLAFLFFCLALPNWFFFMSAGAPVSIGLLLAAASTWLLYQAFLVPIALAGLSGGLLAEIKGKTPDAALCEKINSLVPDTEFPGKSAD
jgi:hypothetical protein